MKYNLKHSKVYLLFYLLLLVAFCVQCEYDVKILSQELSNILKCDKLKETITCEKVKNCTEGVIVPNASYCEACDMCVKFSDIGENCEEIIDDSVRKITLSKCKDGLSCVNGKCDLGKETSNCLSQQRWMLNKRGAGDFSSNLWVPECDDQGKFKAIQRKNGKHICVDEYGKGLFGRGGDSYEDTCACSRFKKKMVEYAEENNNLKYNIRPQEHCSKSGNFDSLQCINDLCYCADETSGEVVSNIVRRDYLDKLPCAKSSTKYLKPCEEEMQRTRHLAYEFSLKGVMLLGANRVECDPDGSFAPRQRQTDRYVCTNEKGVGIGSFYIKADDLKKEPIDMICNCARYGARDAFMCKQNGNYAYLQCFVHERCYCVDDDGAIISNSFSKGSADEDFCQNLLNSLFQIEEEQITTLTETPKPDDEYDYNNDENS